MRHDVSTRQQLAVLGSPIAHSKSPAIHAAAYRELGLDWHYSRVRVGEDGLRPFLAGRDTSWRGLSLTMPLKDEARRLAVSLDTAARLSGVVNTLLRLEDEQAVAAGLTRAEPRWAGFNTDIRGLARAIKRAGLDASRTVVLGAGATAVSAVLAASELGAAHVTVLARREEAATAVTSRLGSLPGELRSGPLAGERAAELARGATLVISTLPGHGVDWGGVGIELGSVPLFDVAYNPWPSAGASAWASAGGEAHSGIDMLVEQALIQVRIFVSGSPDTQLANEARVLEAMRQAA